MSEENLEVVRRYLEAWSSGERSSAWVRGLLHPDVEYLPLRFATEGAYRGIAGIEKFNADTEEVLEKFESHIELLDLGDRVLVWGIVHIRARGSGIETDIPTGNIVDLHDGKIVRWEDFGSKEKALEAVALRE